MAPSTAQSKSRVDRKRKQYHQNQNNNCAETKPIMKRQTGKKICTLQQELWRLVQGILLRRKDQTLKEGTLDSIIDILQQQPRFARVSYKLAMKELPYFEAEKLPLSIVAEAPGATVEQVAAIYELNPDAVQDTTNGAPLPIFRAIARRANPDIIQFLINAFPECLKQSSIRHGHALPIHLILGHWLSENSGLLDSEEHLKVIKLCLDLYPDCIREIGGPNISMRTPLEYAIDYNLPRATDLILERIPKDIDKLCFRSYLGDQNRLLAVKAITHLLPQLLEIHCPPMTGGHCRDAFLNLMKALKEKDTKNLETISLDIPREVLTGNRRTHKALRDAISDSNAHCVKLQIVNEDDQQPGEGADEPTQNDNDLFDVIIGGILASKTRLSSVTFSYLNISCPEKLFHLLTARKCPREMTFCDSAILGSWNMSNRRMRPISDIECFTIHEECEVERDTILHLFDFVSTSCPRLRVLKILDELGCHNAWTAQLDATEPVTLLLQQGTIEQLRVDYPIKLPRLVEILRHETSLKVLYAVLSDDSLGHYEELVDVMEKDNTTLEQMRFEPPVKPEFKRKLDYLLQLNQNGIGIVRDQNVSAAVFVKVLMNVRSEGPAEVETDALRYGILKENPSLWSCRT